MVGRAEAGVGWLASFKKQYSLKNVKLAGGAGSADQEAVGEFFEYLLSVIRKRTIWKRSCLMLMTVICFTRILANKPI